MKSIVQEVVRLLSPSTFTVPPRWGQYDWSSHYKLPTKGQGLIFFAANTYKNLHITLSSEAGITYPLYEIVIGWQESWQYTRSELRRQIPERTVCSYSSLDLTNTLGEDLHYFWICIDAEMQLIYIGQGEHPSEEDAFIIFRDPSFLLNIQYFAFSSNDVAITYTGIKVERKRPALLGNYGQDSSSRLWSCINTSQILPESLYVTFSKSAENYGDYNWSKAYKFPTEGRGIVCFSTNAITDVHVAISPKPGTVDPMYEIVIGGWGNSECVIRRTAQGEKLCRARTIGVIKQGRVNQFWVSINVDTQVIHVGTGNQPNLASVVCMYKDSNFISDARYVSFFSWETTVVYSDILVASPSASTLLNSQPLEVSPCWGKYDWKSGYELLSEGRGILYFAAVASTDGYVAISSEAETMDPMYEIVIGGWGNTKSGIRRCSQGELLCSVNEGFYTNAAHTERVHHFWVSIDRDTQLIQLGRGNQANLESVMCTFKDPSFLSDAKYIAFSSWNTPITYSALSVSFQCTTIIKPIQCASMQAPIETAPIHKRIDQSIVVEEDSIQCANNLLQDPEFKIMVLQNCWGQYEWRQYFELPSLGQGVVYFAAETITDVHIAFSPLPKTVDPMYEIVIGGFNNSKSVLRRESQGPNLVQALAGSGDPPIKPGLNYYWVSIDASTKLIKVGWGKQHKIESSILLIYKDANFISDARYFTFTNWDAPVMYSKISLGTL